MKETLPSLKFINIIHKLDLDPLINIPLSYEIYSKLRLKDSILARDSEAFYNVYCNNTNNIQQTNFMKKKYGSS